MPTKLGQNFLIDTEIAKKIVQSANITRDDIIIEVGPGTGAITALLAAQAKEVYAIELDRSLAQKLEEKYTSVDNIHIIQADILKAQISEILPSRSYKVVANVPYYITSKITRLFLESNLPPTEMVLLVQKEVAQRITAQPGAMSILSASVQYYAEPSYLFTVPAESFDPVPRVESAVIRIVTKNETGHSKEEQRLFFRAVKTGFSAKRKTLCNNLANGFYTDKPEILTIFDTIGLAHNIRAQELSLEQWYALVAALEQKGCYQNSAI